MFAAKKNAGQVDVDNVLPVIECRFLERPVEAYAGAVHQDVQSPPGFADAARAGLPAGFAGDIQREKTVFTIQSSYR